MRLEKWLGALHERNFRLYFLGQLTSSVGTGMMPVALSFAVLACTTAPPPTSGLSLPPRPFPSSSSCSPAAWQPIASAGDASCSPQTS